MRRNDLPIGCSSKWKGMRRANGEIDCGAEKGANNKAPFPPENEVYLADSVKADFRVTLPAFLAVPELDTLDDATLAG